MRSSSSGIGSLLGDFLVLWLCDCSVFVQSLHRVICARSAVLRESSIANEGGIEWKRCCQGHFLIILHDHSNCVIFVSVHKSAENNKVCQHMHTHTKITMIITSTCVTFSE